MTGTLLTEQDLFDAATVEVLYGLIGQKHQAELLERAVTSVVLGVDYRDSQLATIIERARAIARTKQKRPAE